MKNKSSKPIIGKDLSDEINNHSVTPIMIKARISGSMMLVNPPPEDGRCEICNRKTDDLPPWGIDICEGYERSDKQLEELRHTPRCVIISITDDRKLLKHFRSFYDGIIEASWECKDCYYLSDEEAIATRNNFSV
jgi:hypothetical protein